jgi:hypothetical protein
MKSAVQVKRRIKFVILGLKLNEPLVIEASSLELLSSFPMINASYHLRIIFNNSLYHIRATSHPAFTLQHLHV